MKKRSHTILLDNSVDEDNLRTTKKFYNDKEQEDDVYFDDNNIKGNKNEKNLFRGLLDASKDKNREINLDYEPRLNLIDVVDEDDDEDEDYLPNGDNENVEDDQKSDDETELPNENNIIDMVEEDDDIVIVSNNIPRQEQVVNDNEREVMMNEDLEDEEDEEDEDDEDEELEEVIIDEIRRLENEQNPFVVDDRPQCPHGMNCYRNNPSHMNEYSHSYQIEDLLEDDELIHLNEQDVNVNSNVNANNRPQFLDLTDIDDEIVVGPIQNNTNNNHNANNVNTSNNNSNVSNSSDNRRNHSNLTRSQNNSSRNTNVLRNIIRNTNNNTNNTNNDTNNTNNTNNTNTNNNNHNVLDLTSDVIDLTDDSVTFLPPPRNNNNNHHHQRHHQNRRIFSISSASNQIMDFMGINFMFMSNFFNMRRSHSANAQPQRPQRPPRKSSDLVERKKVEGNCPICLDEMKEGPSVCYCRYGCGNNVHTKCFQNWNKDTCVMCREPWN